MPRLSHETLALSSRRAAAAARGTAWGLCVVALATTTGCASAARRPTLAPPDYEEAEPSAVDAGAAE
ncbi:MAG: hypothetical protein FWD17_06375 [Polyangiaceae bacterium]|nr:hypothetical protein [Polyangiaceae bacterium]